MSSEQPKPSSIALKRILQFMNAKNGLLDLSVLGLTSLPNEVAKLQGIRELHLQRNKLITLPADLDTKTIQFLDLSENPLVEIPEGVRTMNRLETLIIEKAKLTKLPSWLTELTSLKYLYLNGNA